MSEPEIIASSVGVSIDGHQLLDDVSMTCAGGNLIALVGPNGAGKSTFLSVVAGDRQPTTGNVTINAVPPRNWKSRELAKVRSVLTQQHDAVFQFSVAEIVAMGRMPQPVSTEDDAIVDAALDSAEVTELRDRDSTTLSGGELARTMFAKVLAQTTAVVLLDEPTAALDLRHQERVMRTAAQLASQGNLVLAVLHDLNLAARYCDRIAMFDQGRLVADGPPEQVLTASRIEQVYGQSVQIIRHPVTDGPLMVPL